ncbi:immunity protein YezG family protein [Bacillus australimaris]|uniref:immunity protein YezG family protein n=1 Tax=Bacillus australimaris TaxID=1326968 RepID=UPI0039B49623
MENTTIDPIYQKIAGLINNNIPVEWGNVRLYAEVVKHETEITFYFNKKGGKEFIYGHNIPELFNISESVYVNFLVELTRLFRQLKTFYEKNNYGSWTNFTLEMEYSGKFSIEYGYEDIFSLGIDGDQRIAVWEYETFGFLPDDEEDKEAVLNYLKNKDNN